MVISIEDIIIIVRYVKGRILVSMNNEKMYRV